MDLQDSRHGTPWIKCSLREFCGWKEKDVRRDIIVTNAFKCVLNAFINMENAFKRIFKNYVYKFFNAARLSYLP